MDALGERGNFKNFSRKLAINRFQNILHKLINSFLDGSLLSRRGIYLYPFIEEYSSLKIEKHLDDLIYCIEEINKYYEYDLEYVVKEINFHINRKIYCSTSIAEIISHQYSILDRIIHSEENTDTSEIICDNEFVIQNYQNRDRKYLKPVIELRDYVNSYLQEKLLGFYIHGSLSTLDYIKGASDLDTLVIIKAETVLNVRYLLRLKCQLIRSLHYLYMIDPLQHHGHFVITEIDMKYYPQIYFPFVLFNYSTVISGKQHLTFCERESEAECVDMLWKMCSNNFDKSVLRQNISNIYGMKYFLSIIQLIPTIYLQVFDCPCYKKFSFQKIKEIFDDESWKIIQKATRIRKNWIYRYSFYERTLSKIIPNPFFLSLYYRKFKKKIPPYIYEILDDSYLEEYFRLRKQIARIMREKHKIPI